MILFLTTNTTSKRLIATSKPLEETRNKTKPIKTQRFLQNPLEREPQHTLKVNQQN